VTPEGSIALTASPRYKTDEELDHDIEEAIRLSMLDDVEDTVLPSSSTKNSSHNVQFTVRQKNSRRSPSASSPNSLQSGVRISSSPKANDIAMDDLDLALKLSLAEEQSRREILAFEKGDEEFPVLEKEVTGKGKGRAV